ncbi:hypothetical protein OGATHE_001064 [Ogataea polymorpha]|uniref:Uncharacterized protein n=1 Tax=Ogataea polymorpha TaxID=460523 RepID=A0A9P8PS42_9ASCO|nr:hypothetical protein OGATHE_001064 [Ogataea polymorpha]
MEARSMFLSNRTSTILSAVECCNEVDAPWRVFITWSRSFWSSRCATSSAGPPLLDLMIGTEPIVRTAANSPLAILSAMEVMSDSVVFGLLNWEYTLGKSSENRFGSVTTKSRYWSNTCLILPAFPLKATFFANSSSSDRLRLEVKLT